MYDTLRQPTLPPPSQLLKSQLAKHVLNKLTALLSRALQPMC